MITKKLTITLISISLLSIIITGKIPVNQIISKSVDELSIDELIDQKSEKLESKEHLITLFVHGTVIPVPSFSALDYSFNKFTPKASSCYQKYLNYLRDEIYGICQPGRGLGLKKINLEEEKNKKNDINYLYVKSYEQMLEKVDPNENQKKSFYTFGWNGRLDQKKRVQAAEELYKSLVTELEKIKKENPNQKIVFEVVAHSHGGNVVLNLGLAEQKFKKNLLIDKTTLLGTPIQNETKDFVHSDVFKKIYNFYSKGDMIQVIDVISTSAKSRRKIKTDQPSSKVVHVQLRAGKLNPRHTELWLWGERAPIIFRKDISFYPYPVATYVPIITSYIEKNLPEAKKLKLNIEKHKNSLDFNFFDKFLTQTNSSIQEKSNHIYALADLEQLRNQVKQKIL